jgi:L-asparaginase
VTQTNTKPRIAILATGGTIASVAANQTQLADYKVSAGIDELVAAVPAIEEIASLEFTQVSNVESHEVGDEILGRLAQAVQQYCDREDVTGVVITHGTDTLEETAYYLHLTIDTSKPIVLVGAMRPGSAISADGPLNLFHAVVVASHPSSIGKGVLVVMNDRIASARHVTKGHANGVDAFGATEFGYLGLVFGQWVRYQNALLLRHTSDSEFKQGFEQATLPRVDIVYDHQGATMHHFSASIESGARGVVLAATGQGSLSPQGSQGARAARQAGVVVVRSSRVWQGVVRPSVRDQEFGTIAGSTLNAPKARILLRLALAQGADVPQIQQWFETH